MKNIVFIVTSILIFQVGFTQVNLWTPSKSVEYGGVGYQIETVSDLYFEFDLQSFQEKVKNMPDDFVISLPIDKTTFADFKLNVNTTMSEGLMEKFPSIRAFDGKSLDHSGRTAKIDIGPNYFRAMILQPGGEDLFIDPVVFNHVPQSNYMLYSRNELISTKEFSCLLESQNGHEDKLIPVEFNQQKSIQSCELRTYRLAVSATGEYTIFHGGTVAGALAAQVTTMNRVNGIYERDLAVTMTLIPNNDLLIFTNPSTDPFTNGQPGAMINENPDVVDDAIGSSNYDIGHVFGTNSGGLAYLNSVCKSYKAGGVTGSGAPIGDPFDVDYVSHEMGHQFGANHTFNNSCNGNRNNGTAMEPGSGSTIMAYAGICNPNVQGNSDGYFHAVSLSEIGTVLNSTSHTCPVKISLSNVKPEIITSSMNIQIPISTPFMLSIEANDNDGDAVTYTFEQMDNEISTQAPLATSNRGPNFRSVSPSTESYRYFPSLISLVGNQQTWERLSSVARTFNFRATVRDNAANGGCTTYEDYTVTTVSSAGPFVVTYPSSIGIVWEGLTQETITWDVANTTAAPISCENVEILLSQDWGVTFSTLVESTPNTGSLEITVPNIDADRAMIMVRSEEGTFFDISDYRFKIVKNTVGIEQEELSTVTLFPNPVESTLRVNLRNAEYMNGYQIYSSSGQLVQEDHRQIFSDSTIDVSGLDNGVYFFHVMIGDSNRVLKFVKK